MVFTGFLQITADVYSRLGIGSFFKIEDIGSLISGLLGASLLIASILFVLFLLWSATRWITAGGDKSQVEMARQRLTNATTGLIIIAAIWATFFVVVYILGLPIRLTGSGSGPPPPIPTSTPAPPGDCGSKCTESSECNGTLKCVDYSYCANLSCPSESTCICPDPTPTPTPTPLPTPTPTPATCDGLGGFCVDDASECAAPPIGMLDCTFGEGCCTAGPAPTPTPPPPPPILDAYCYTESGNFICIVPNLSSGTNCVEKCGLSYTCTSVGSNYPDADNCNKKTKGSCNSPPPSSCTDEICPDGGICDYDGALSTQWTFCRCEEYGSGDNCSTSADDVCKKKSLNS